MTDRELTIRKSDAMGDWYVIEWAEHDGREWMERSQRYPNVSNFMRSARVSDADVEGPGSEMRAAAQAIIERGEFSARRLEVRVAGDSTFLSSPRNSSFEEEVPYTRALALAHKILATVEE